MNIRYQNGAALEAITLFKNEQTMRLAIRGQDDVMELTNVHGIWVSEDCEPVTVEMAMTTKNVEAYSEDDFICSPELAGHLLRLLVTGDDGAALEELSPYNLTCADISSMIA